MIERANQTTCKDAQKNLFSMIDEVCESHVPFIINGENGKSVVMISLQDFRGIEETVFLMSRPKNSERLLKKIQNVKRIVKELEVMVILILLTILFLP